MQGHAGSQAADRSSSLRRGTNGAHVAQWTKRLVADQGGAGSSPAVCSNHQHVGEPGRPCLAWNQEIGGSNPPALTNWPRSSADESGRLLNGGSGLQFTPGPRPRMVGRAVKQRGANASRPFLVAQVRSLPHPPPHRKSPLFYWYFGRAGWFVPSIIPSCACDDLPRYGAVSTRLAPITPF